MCSLHSSRVESDLCTLTCFICLKRCTIAFGNRDHIYCPWLGCLCQAYVHSLVPHAKCMISTAQRVCAHTACTLCIAALGTEHSWWMWPGWRQRQQICPFSTSHVHSTLFEPMKSTIYLSQMCKVNRFLSSKHFFVLMFIQLCTKFAFKYLKFKFKMLWYRVETSHDSKLDQVYKPLDGLSHHPMVGSGCVKDPPPPGKGSLCCS